MENARRQIWRERTGVAYEVERERPIDQPDRQFERTAPVHAVSERTLIEPGRQLLEHGSGVHSIASGTIRTREHDKVLVTIGFPDDLRVTHHVEVPVVDRARETKRGRTVVRNVPVPIDRRGQLILTPEDVEAMSNDALGPGDQTLAP